MGSNWTYQPDPTLFELLRRSIKEYSEEFRKGRRRRDKTTIPMYLFLCGAGTGKSRNAQEFHHSLLACLTEKEDWELKKRVKDAWVFHVSLKNGTSPLPTEATPLEVVGNRMLLQLLPDQSICEVADKYKVTDPMDIVKLLAKHRGQNWKSASVVLVVDGLQSFRREPNDGHSPNSTFYQALTNIADLAHGEVFLVVCCTATATTPVDQALTSTHRNRVVLPVASLNPPHIAQGDNSLPVFDDDDHIVKVLVSDCGGHGRALESLQQVIEESGIHYNVESLMNNLRLKLENRRHL